MAEVRMTLEEYEALRRMISSERESEGAELADRMDSTISAAADKPKRKASPRISAELRPELCRYQSKKLMRGIVRRMDSLELADRKQMLCA